MKCSHILFNILIVLSIYGCSGKQEYIELTKDAFLNLEASKVIEVDAIFIDRDSSGLPNTWIRIYPNLFPIGDPNKIMIIINCIKAADFDSKYNDRKILLIEAEEVSLDTRKVPDDPVMHKNILKNIYSINDPNLIKEIENYIRKETSVPIVRIDEKIPFFRMLFKTDEEIYFIRILWDDESFYGDWWDSPELLNNFKTWGLFKKQSKADPNRKFLKAKQKTLKLPIPAGST